jgi:hypothetical protein
MAKKEKTSDIISDIITYGPTQLAKAEPRRQTIFDSNGKQIGMVGIGSSLIIKRVAPKSDSKVPEATPEQYKELYSYEAMRHLIEVVKSGN